MSLLEGGREIMQKSEEELSYEKHNLQFQRYLKGLHTMGMPPLESSFEQVGMVIKDTGCVISCHCKVEGSHSPTAQCPPAESQGKGVWVMQSVEVSIERHGAEQRGADGE